MDPPLQRTQVSKQSNNTLEPKSQIQPTRARGRDPQPKSQNASEPKAARRRTTNEPRIRSVLPKCGPVRSRVSWGGARAGGRVVGAERARRHANRCGVWGVGCGHTGCGRWGEAAAEGGALSGHVRREVPSAGTCTATSGARARDHDIIGVTTTTV